MNIWNCELAQEPKSHLKDIVFEPKSSEVFKDQFSIGQKIPFVCRGEPVVSTSSRWSWISNLESEDESSVPKFHLSSLDFISNTQVNLSLHSYQVGENNLSLRLFNDGNNTQEEILIENLSFYVDSVLQEHDFYQNPKAASMLDQELLEASQMQPLPYPPIGPVKMSYPLYLWLLLALILILIGGFIVRKWIQVAKFKRLRKEIKSNLPAAGSLSYFYKNLRTMNRSNEGVADYLKKLEENYKDFLQNEFLFPIDDFSKSFFKKIVKKERKFLADKDVIAIFLNLKELSVLRTKENINFSDIGELLKQIQSSVEAVAKSKDKSKDNSKDKKP